MTWNIHGNTEAFKHCTVTNFLHKFDVIFLSETHAIQNTNIFLNNYEVYDYPDKNCNIEYPRGGCILLIRNFLIKYIASINHEFTDCVQIVFVNNSIFNFQYIPPSDSTYFSPHYIAIMAELFMHAKFKKYPLITLGDLNSRMGTLQLKNFTHVPNPDITKNNNGTNILENIIHQFDIIPLNGLKYKNHTFDTNFTFFRGDQRSQIDLGLTNKHALSNIKNFIICNNAPEISDHKPLYVKYHLLSEYSMDHTYKAIRQINRPKANHSSLLRIRNDKINFNLCKNLINIHTKNIMRETTETNLNNTQIAQKLEKCIKSAAYISFHKNNNNNLHSNQNISNNNMDSSDSDSDILNQVRKHEFMKWSCLMEKNDPKEIWSALNWRGELNKNIDDDLHSQELANFFQERCQIDPDQSKLENICFEAENDYFEPPISQEEISDNIENIKDNSTTTDGFNGYFLKCIATEILPLLLILFNSIFNDGSYPCAVWWCLMFGISKKGKFQLPNNIRGITIMSQIAKVYDAIICNRIIKKITIPKNQSAYQKKRGCFLNVMAIRIFILISKKCKMKFYVIFSDFAAAFDSISRLKLLQKLVKIGLSITLINAIRDMYTNIETLVLHNGEFSNTFYLDCGVKQGAPSSGILFIAYIIDLINIFCQEFPIENIIGRIHLLIHADDTAVLAYGRQNAINKIKRLSRYCLENCIKLQPTKCSFLVTNSEESDQQPIMVNNQSIPYSTSEIYLGSFICASGNINDHIKGEINYRKKSIIKYYSFLRKNPNIPMIYKLKVLDACILSSLIYNSETWGPANIEKLELEYRKMLKTTLGVKLSTCNEFPFIELNLPTIKTRIHQKQYKFWLAIKELENDDPVKIAVQLAEQYNLDFVKHYHNLERIYSNVDIHEYNMNEIRNNILRKAENNKTKYITYLKINPSLQKSNIYFNHIPRAKLQYSIKLRTISHDLIDEIGRRKNIPKDLRLCHCKKAVETEEHFLLRCVEYTDIRYKYNIESHEIHEILNENYLEYINELVIRRKALMQNHS